MDWANALRELPVWQQKALLFVSVLLLGYLVIKFGERLIDRAMHKSQRIDDTLANFLDSVTNVIGWVVLGAILLTIAGVDLAALLGGLAIGGFVLGFALKDTLGNLAAGVMLLFYRPYQVGDTVTIAGDTGDVVDLGVSLTTMKAGDGRIITIPNGKILNGVVINHSRNDIRRADVLVGIGYGDDIQEASQAILAALREDERVLAEPAPSIRIRDLGDNAVGLQVRPWVKTEHFWQAQADFHGTVKHALDRAGMTIPYPQRDVHMHTSG